MKRALTGLLICVLTVAMLFGSVITGKDEALAESLKVVGAAPGYSHYMALLNNGNLYAWGDNSYGQLGNGTYTSRTKENPVLVGTGFTQVVAGDNHTLALKGGTLYAWGDNRYGQLGCGTFMTENAPVQIGTGFTKISACADHSYAIKTNGNLYGWGENGIYDPYSLDSHYWIGDGTTGNKNSPVLVGTGFTQVSTGGRHTLALKGSNLFAWGSNSFGQLGNGESGDGKESRVPIPIGTGFTHVAAGSLHSLALKGGDLYAWGSNRSYQLGDGTDESKSSPVKIGSGCTTITAEGICSYALKNTDLFYWGQGYVRTPSLFGTGYQQIVPYASEALCIDDTGLFLLTYNSYRDPQRERINIPGVLIYPSDVTLSRTSAIISADETLVLVATVSPDDTSNLNVTWTSDNTSVAGVSDGFVTGKSAGTAKITAASILSPEKKATCTVTVTSTDISVSEISLSSSSTNLKIAETATLSTTILPANATNKSITWTSENPSVATVANGIITGKGIGTTTITATSASNPIVKAICTVVVTENDVAVTGITLSKDTLSLKVGESNVLTATITPANATDKTVNWVSDNSSVASVSGGTITAKGAGTTKITATSNSNPAFKATCTVTVVEAGQETVSVTGIKLSKNTVKIATKKTTTLTAKIVPANATNKTVRWKSSNKKVAKVDQRGSVTGIADGTAVITATTADGKKTATCTITVTGPVRSVVFAQKTMYLKKGTTATLDAVVITSDGTEASLVWTSSSPETVSVSKNGKVKALKPGKATITAKALNGKSAKVTVNVSGKPAKSISIKNPPKKNTMKPGSTLKLKIALKPTNAQGALKFTTSNKKVVSVDASGQLTALKKGSARITVTLGKKKATLRITVR